MFMQTWLSMVVDILECVQWSLICVLWWLLSIFFFFSIIPVLYVKIIVHVVYSFALSTVYGYAIFSKNLPWYYTTPKYMFHFECHIMLLIDSIGSHWLGIWREALLSFVLADLYPCTHMCSFLLGHPAITMLHSRKTWCMCHHSSHYSLNIWWWRGEPHILLFLFIIFYHGSQKLRIRSPLAHRKAGGLSKPKRSYRHHCSGCVHHNVVDHLRGTMSVYTAHTDNKEVTSPQPPVTWGELTTWWWSR